MKTKPEKKEVLQNGLGYGHGKRADTPKKKSANRLRGSIEQDRNIALGD
ncbi:hypothetical protein ACQRDF_10145 [Lachnospiraceae bacterium SGI.054]